MDSFNVDDYIRDGKEGDILLPSNPTDLEILNDFSRFFLSLSDEELKNLGTTPPQSVKDQQSKSNTPIQMKGKDENTKPKDKQPIKRTTETKHQLKKKPSLLKKPSPTSPSSLSYSSTSTVTTINSSVSKSSKSTSSSSSSNTPRRPRFITRPLRQYLKYKRKTKDVRNIVF